MSMRYLSGVEALMGTRRTIARVGDVVVGAERAIATRPTSVGAFLRELKESDPPVIPLGVGTLAGGAAGAILWGKHRVLGAIGGMSIGTNGPALLRPELRREALCNLGQTGVAVLGSRLLSGTPVLGFLAGWIAGGAAIYWGGLRR